VRRHRAARAAASRFGKIIWQGVVVVGLICDHDSGGRERFHPQVVHADRLALLAAGRRQGRPRADRFIPDCIALFGRLIRDDRVPRRSKLLLAGPDSTLPYPLRVRRSGHA
jgi:hypothetical protein